MFLKSVGTFRNHTVPKGAVNQLRRQATGLPYVYGTTQAYVVNLSTKRGGGL